MSKDSFKDRGFSEQKLALLASMLEKEGVPQAPSLTRIPRDKELPLSPAQTGLWLLDQLEPGSAAYNIPVRHDLKGHLDLGALERSVSEIVRRHEVLRTYYLRVNHLIGHLQSNKAARAAEIFDGVDSLDSVRLAERLNEAAGKTGKRLPVLIEVKLSPEATKNGVEPESHEAAQLLERLPDLLDLETRGLMRVAPWGAQEDETRACFRNLRMWRDRWAGAHPNLKFDVLSMD